jgi:hypothetical protein
MKYALLLTALLAANAFAQSTSCQTHGWGTSCSDGSTYQRNGNRVQRNDGTSWHTPNDGKNWYGSDGSTWTQRPYGMQNQNGRICRSYGSQVICQ